MLLHYAIADVAWFVDDGDPLDTEAWQRGATQYLPDGKAGLYPPVLAEGAASLLPDGPRPAVVFHVRVDADGQSKLDGAERSLIRSTAKLAYETVKPAQLPNAFAELARRIAHAEDVRGASRIEPFEQVVTATGHGGYDISFRHDCNRKTTTRRCLSQPIWPSPTRCTPKERACSGSCPSPINEPSSDCDIRREPSASNGRRPLRCATSSVR